MDNLAASVPAGESCHWSEACPFTELSKDTWETVGQAVYFLNLWLPHLGLPPSIAPHHGLAVF